MKKHVRAWWLLALAGLLALPLAAQEAGKTAEKPSAPKAEKKAPMPKASAEMVKTSKALLGRWSVSEKFEASELGPGGTGEGQSRIYRGPGGLALIQEYRSINSLGTFRGHGVMWWNPLAQAFNGVWCDNATPGGCEMQGEAKWDGEQLVWNGVSEASGKKITFRSVYSDFKPDSFAVKMEFSVAGGPMKPGFILTYTRLAEEKEKTEAKAEKQ